jgi:hypothetical protein
MAGSLKPVLSSPAKIPVFLTNVLEKGRVEVPKFKLISVVRLRTPQRLQLRSA